MLKKSAARKTEKCKSISRKIVSIAQYSHVRTPKKAISWCTKKDVIRERPMKLGDGRAPIKNSCLGETKTRPFWPPPPPQKTADLKKGGSWPKICQNGQNPPKKADFQKTGGGCRSGGGGPTPHQKKLVRVPPLRDFFVRRAKGGGPPKL